MSREDPSPSQSPEIPLEDEHPSLWSLLDRFHLALEALREMIEDFLPIVIEREKQRLGSAAMADVESLEPEKQARLRHYLEAMVDKARSGEPSNIESDDVIVARMQEVFEGDRYSLISFADRMRKATSGPDRTAIMHNSLLAQAIGSFEVLVSGVITRYFFAHPGALETGQKEFSLADLREFSDVEDAVDFLTVRQVNKIMYGGLEEWAAWFEKRCNFDLPALALDWDHLLEAFQRRHVIMHNGGLVSRAYLAKVKFHDEPPKVGQRLPVDAEYLHNALDELEVLGTLLAVMAWGSWHRDERDRSAGALLQRSYDLMLAGRWKAVEKLTQVGNRLKCSAATKEPIKVNGWISRLELYGPQAIRDEVLEWDVSVAVGRFRLAKLVLLDQLDEASTLAARLLRNNELTRGQLKEWPLLRRLREHGGLDVGPSESPGSQESSSDDD